MTPEERAARITDGWKGVVVKAVTTDARFAGDGVILGGDMPEAVADQIAAAIREAVAECAEHEGDAGVARLENLVGRWMEDPRAAKAVAEDCDGNEGGSCPCLYCDSVRALCGK